MRQLILATMILAGTVASAPAPVSPSQAPIAQITLQEYFGKLRKVQVTVNGSKRDFLFDTGGGYTSIDPSIATAAGCRSRGMLTGFRMSGERLDMPKCGRVELVIDGMRLETEAGKSEISALLPKELPPLYGIISLQTFKNHAITLDLANNRIIVESDESLRARTATMTPLDVNFFNEMDGRGLDVFLRVNTAADAIYMLLDSGDLAGNFLRPSTWQELADTDAAPAPGENGELTFDFGKAGRLTLPVQAKDMIHEGVLDVRFVEFAVFTFDFPNRRAWIRFNDKRGSI
ncbi:MAG: hypothetical protein P8099_17435 [Gemmatimonadota bacterium]